MAANVLSQKRTIGQRNNVDIAVSLGKIQLAPTYHWLVRGRPLYVVNVALALRPW